MDRYRKRDMKRRQSGRERMRETEREMDKRGRESSLSLCATLPPTAEIFPFVSDWNVCVCVRMCVGTGHWAGRQRTVFQEYLISVPVWCPTGSYTLTLTHTHTHPLSETATLQPEPT